MRKITLATILISFFIMGCGGDDTETISIKKESIEQLLNEYEDCQSTAESAKDCKDFTAKAISKYYGVGDLMKDGKYIEYPAIYDFVSSSSAWGNLGDANNQSVMDKAQQYANEGVPVIAINTKDKYKLTVLIIAGEQKTSSKWGVKVANAAAFFPKNGPNPFVNKTLNYAWGSPDGVEIWARN